MLSNTILYGELFYEFVVSSGGVGLLTKYMLSGKECLTSAKEGTSKAEAGELVYDTLDIMSVLPPMFLYFVKLNEVVC